MGIYVKIMSGENLPDANNSKCFTIHACDSVEFRREASMAENSVAVADLYIGDGEDAEFTTVELTGNAYVLNDNGKTIASFAYTHSP